MGPDLFDPAVVADTIRRLEQLTPDRRPLWGRMSAAEMLAHVNVAYEMVYTDRHARPNPLVRLLLRLFVKQGVCGPKPYPRSAPTAPC